MAVIVGLYLYDSTLLLYRNQGILELASREEWRVTFGSSGFQLLGKEIYVPNPVMPHRPLFLLSWDFEGQMSEAKEDFAGHAKAIEPLRPIVWCMAFALFVLLPMGFFTKLGEVALILAISLLYISIIVALTWLWFKRAKFRLSPRQFAALAFEFVVCSPFAVNLVRRLTLNVAAGEDLVHASCRLQGEERWNTTRENLVARLDERIEDEREDSERMAKLVEHRRRLMEQFISCPLPKSS